MLCRGNGEFWLIQGVRKGYSPDKYYSLLRNKFNNKYLGYICLKLQKQIGTHQKYLN